MNLFKFLFGSRANLSNVAVKSGNLIVSTDSTYGNELYADSGTTRYKVGYSTKEVDDKLAAAVGVDGDKVTTVKANGKISAICTATPRANTLVKTQSDGKISTDFLASAGLMSSMQLAYLVPSSTTWTISPDKCVTTTGLPLSVAASTSYKLASPFGTLPAIAEAYIKNPTSGIWSRVDSFYNSGSGQLFGLTVNCPGDGYVYLTTGTYLQTSTQGSSAPTASANVANAEVVIALYCQKTTVTATRVIGARQKYLVAKNTSWNRSAAVDTITLSDMPLTFSGGTPTTKKFVSPFGTTPVKLESWVLFSGKWRKEHLFYSGSSYFGHMAMCPGDGYIYFNYGTYPQNTDVAASTDNIPTGTTGADGSTCTTYQICLVATVHEAVDLPTVSAKDMLEIGALGVTTTDLSALVAAGTTAATAYVWYAPSNGFVTVAKTVSDDSVGALRMDVAGTAVGLGRVNENANPQVVSAPVLKGQKYTMYRSSTGVTFTFTPVVYDATKLVLSDKVTTGLRVGELRYYSSLDTSLASNTSFLNVSSATTVNTSLYPEFAAIVGVNTAYAIPAATSLGAGTIPYLYLGAKSS